MGELFDIPEWLLATLFVVGVLSIWMAVGAVGHARMLRRTAAKRPNPTCEEFAAMMAEAGVSPEAAEFLWQAARFYVEPRLTPHPDDELGADLFIDDGDWSLDWPRDYAERQGFHESNLPEWPNGWPPTLRNYGRWLSSALA